MWSEGSLVGRGRGSWFSSCKATFKGGYYKGLSFAAPKSNRVETICQASSGRDNDIPWEQTGTGTDAAHLRMKCSCTER